MAVLTSGNVSVDIRFHGHYSPHRILYTFKPEIADLALVNSALNKERCAGGRYTCCCIWGYTQLIPFLEGLITDQLDAEWNQGPETTITLRAETWKSKKEERMKGWENKTVLVTDFEGKLKREPYTETINFLAPFFEEFLELYIIFNHSFFVQGAGGFSDFEVSLKFNLSFDELRKFLDELKIEYEIFKQATNGDQAADYV